MPRHLILSEKTTLSAFSVGFAKAITSANNSNSVVDFQIYDVQCKYRHARYDPEIDKNAD